MASRLGRYIAIYAEDHGGEAYGAETRFVLTRAPDTLLGPDASYIRSERITPGLPEDEYLPIAPDLAVEVLSPSNTRAEMAEKVQAYLDGGTALVWIVDPIRRIVTIHGPDRTAQTCGEGDTLEGGDVLPGFRLLVADIFARPDGLA